MSTHNYMCPCCGAPLAYSGASGKLECASCGNSYELDLMEAMEPAGESGEVKFEIPDAQYAADDAAQMSAYICQGCGAELLTDNTTTATECPYCGSPTVLPDRIEGGVKPETVVPFVLTKEEAQQKFYDYFKGKLLLPNIFLETRNRITEMRKLYVPYWLFDCDADGSMVFDAESRHTERQGDWEITRTEHYLVRRAGKLSFENIPVDGSEKLDNSITESLEPYDLSKAVQFQPAVLAGAMADHADVDAEACEGRAAERVEESVAATLRNTVHGYTSVRERSRNIHAMGGKVTPVLMPVWLITTEKEGKTYTFAINGQTGKLTCDVPADVKKSVLWGGGTFVGAAAIAMLILYFMEMMETMPIIIGLVIALVIALIVLGILRGQLNQAELQSAAQEYIKEDSFELYIDYDSYLYTTTSRRKIESGNKED